jgi:hypothetical protein
MTRVSWPVEDTLETPFGYSDEEWARLMADTQAAKVAGSCPPPVRIHDRHGRHTSTLRYVGGLWRSFSENPEPLSHLPSEPRPIKDSFVYFVGGDDGSIKIGEALDPARRLRELQCGSPVLLRILATATGGQRQERAYHDRFHAHRLHGEWFARVPEIEAEIARLQEAV